MSDVDRRILDVVTVTRALAYHNIIKGKYFMKFIDADGFRLEDIGRMDDIGDIGVFIRYRCIIVGLSAVIYTILFANQKF